VFNIVVRDTKGKEVPVHDLNPPMQIQAMGRRDSKGKVSLSSTRWVNCLLSLPQSVCLSYSQDASRLFSMLGERQYDRTSWCWHWPYPGKIHNWSPHELRYSTRWVYQSMQGLLISTLTQTNLSMGQVTIAVNVVTMCTGYCHSRFWRVLWFWSSWSHSWAGANGSEPW